MKLWGLHQVRIHRGGGGGQGVRTPSGKSQMKWVSIGYRQLDTPWKKLDPLEKVGPPGKKLDPICPSGALKNDRFLWNWPFDFCKISWGLKKLLSELFCQTDLDPPPPPDENSWIRASVPCLPTVNIQKRMLYCHISSFQAHAVPILFVCLFDLILYVHSTIFQLCGTVLPGFNQY